MTKRVVTERDLRAPEFAEGTPDDYEFRDDGKIVRKDRWERGIHSIAAILGHSRRGFEIPDLVEELRLLVEAKEAAEGISFTALIDELVLSWSTGLEETEELQNRRVNARLALEEAIKRVVGTVTPKEEDTNE